MKLKTYTVEMILTVKVKASDELDAEEEALLLVTESNYMQNGKTDLYVNLVTKNKREVKP